MGRVDSQATVNVNLSLVFVAHGKFEISARAQEMVMSSGRRRETIGGTAELLVVVDDH